MKQEKWIERYGEHFQKAYLSARAKLPFAALSDVIVGAQSAVYSFDSLPVVIKIARITGEKFKGWQENYGQRAFDCPLLSSEVIETPAGILRVSIAPRVEVFKGHSSQLNKLESAIHKAGYETVDWRAQQAGLLNGRPVLVDYPCATDIAS